MFGRVGVTLRTFSFLKGRRAMHADSQKIIGRVEDVVADSKGNVLGFIICEKKLSFSFRKKYVPYASVSMAGQDSVLLCSCGPYKIPFQAKGTFTMVKHPRCILKQALLSKDGETDAVVEDVYFSDDWGRIVAIEVTKGLFSDWTDGRSLIYSHEPLTIGKQSLFVR
ncbi:PRC-barrel domain-containing protein [Fictibacillus sp. KIGAM418]|uniref:PRC-barrel domain-containing protein n=2 Tax=Fictibacillus marinisediminis TaxID=2878389 RepID=A0A9X1XC81_9BACL|nr:PRC-barrel domain-containing protein [Fictibacillus marinisediminis]MCK6257868.1 PRC-barrel domain-containing protein [Fictibacillus marinisediminis]